MKIFKEKFGDAATSFDVSIREDRFFVSEILALDSFIARLDDIPLFANQLVLINLATLDVRLSTPGLTVGHLPQARFAIAAVPYCSQTLDAFSQHSPISTLNPTHRHYHHHTSLLTPYLALLPVRSRYRNVVRKRALLPGTFNN